jgi:hypothetical protein
MQFEDQLKAAFESVTIVQLARELGISLQEGGGQRSPFREDAHAGSFSVMRSGFKDHAAPDHKGGHIAFVQLARPGWSKKECIEFVIRAAGLEPERLSAGKVKREANERRVKMYSRAQARLEALPALGCAEPCVWPSAIRDRWNEGQAAILPHLGKLAEGRGWPESAVRKLIGLNKTSLPLLPWVDGGEKRGWAWIVEKPVFGLRGEASLVPVGFHARYKVFEAGKVAEKRWAYVPYVPAEKPGMSEFQRFLSGYGARCPAYPFVLGSPSKMRLGIVLEGQFDAVSLALAFGWLERGLPPGVAVFGLRGVQSQAAFLAAYGPALRRDRPFVWVIGDNDEAGRALVRRTNAGSLDGEPSFLDRLRAQGCTVAGRFYAIEGCKDFNDIWAAHRPDREQMQSMAGEAGCGDLTLGG